MLPPLLHFLNALAIVSYLLNRWSGVFPSEIAAAAVSVSPVREKNPCGFFLPRRGRLAVKAAKAAFYLRRHRNRLYAFAVFTAFALSQKTIISSPNQKSRRGFSSQIQNVLSRLCRSSFVPHFFQLAPSFSQKDSSLFASRRKNRTFTF
jgi:hypothetical protein